MLKLAKYTVSWGGKVAAPLSVKRKGGWLFLSSIYRRGKVVFTTK